MLEPLRHTQHFGCNGFVTGCRHSSNSHGALRDHTDGIAAQADELSLGACCNHAAIQGWQRSVGELLPAEIREAGCIQCVWVSKHRTECSQRSSGIDMLADCPNWNKIMLRCCMAWGIHGPLSSGKCWGHHSTEAQFWPMLEHSQHQPCLLTACYRSQLHKLAVQSITCHSSMQHPSREDAGAWELLQEAERSFQVRAASRSKRSSCLQQPCTA